MEDSNTIVSRSATRTAQPPATPPSPRRPSAAAAAAVAAAGRRRADVERMRAEAAAEIDRIAAIRRICAGEHAEIEARAIREGWDETRTELEVLRASRPTAPAMHVRHRVRSAAPCWRRPAC